MISLQDGEQYFLSSDDKSNRSLIFVKLTDSALQSIETYLKTKDDASSKPTIEFDNNSGTISLPLNERTHNYGFTLSNIEGSGIQNSLQCIQHTGEKSLEALGFMVKKMQILANEDSYEKTKVKMTAAEQEQKSFCTKEIRQNGTCISKKVKVTRLGQKQLPLSSKEIVQNGTHLDQRLEGKHMESLVKQPIRERIIHILAAKPYRKPEILLRLKKEGLTERDKDRISDILIEVGTFKGNIFSLSNPLWNEVQENWEFCSKEELQLIRKRKLQYCKSSSTNESANLSKSSSIQKGLSSETTRTPSQQCNKKQRVSLNGAKKNSNSSKGDSSTTSNFIKTDNQTSGSSKKSSIKVNDVFCGASKKISSINHKHNSITIPAIQPLLPREFQNEEINHRKAKKMCLDTENGDKVNHQSETSNLSNLVSVFQARNDTTSHSQIIRSNGCQETNSLLNSDKNSSKHLSVLDKRKIEYQVSCNSSLSSIKDKFNEFLPQQRSQCLNNKSFQRSKYLQPIQFIQPLPIRCYAEQIGTDTELPFPTDSVSKFDCSETKLKYGKIESADQRTQYVKDFNNQYEEYLKLHMYIKDVSEKFSVLFENLHTIAKGSTEHQKIKVRIAKEYKKTLEESDYIHSRKKYDYLKSKLSYIRELIVKYDSNHSPVS